MTGTADTAPKVNKIQTNYTTLDYQEVVFRANQYGWPSIVTNFNTPHDCLTGKKTVCPLCGEKKFRFKLNSDGNCRYICICTGSKYRDGFSLIAEINSIDNKSAFKAVAEFLGLNNSTKKPINELGLNNNIEEYRRKQKALEQERQAKIVSDKDAGEAHAKAVMTNCEMGEHQDFIRKGYKHEVLINKKPYQIPYQRTNEKGTVENKTQIVPVGAAVLPIRDIDNPSRIISFQFISPHIDTRTGKHTKLMLVDSITAGFCVIHGDDALPYIAVAEGYRTSLSINVSLGCTVAVLFDANGIKSRTKRIKELFPSKEILVCGDNDKGQNGQKAAHTAAFHTKSKAIIPLNSGTDWDDYRCDYGEDYLRAEINRQITELSFKPVEIKSSITGISANSSILLASGDGFSFADALINHTGKHCICPISGEKAIINAGSIYCYETRQVITPIIASLYDAELVAKYKKLTSTKKRLKELSDNSDPKNVYAFTTALSHRVGADIPSSRFKDWLYLKSQVVAPDEIINFIQCLSRARINQSKNLIALDPKRFKNRIHLKQKNGLLDWLNGVEKAKSGGFKVVAVKAQHGQGKSQDFMKQMFNHALGLGGAVAIAHRRKLVTQLADVLECIHYQDDSDYISYAGGVKNLACCLHSFKHEKFLNHLVNSHSIFIDEASQALKAFYTDSNIEKGLAKKFSESAKHAQCVYLLDADLTENDIKRWASLLGVNEDEILVITAEPPVRDFTVNLTCTASLKYFKTSIVESIKQDLILGVPCVLAVESEAAARSIHKYFKERFPDKKIVLLSGKLPAGEIDPFIENIQVKMASTDLLIHTSVIGTGVSIQHANKRFKKGYGLFTGSILSATESLQMLRRCRDVNSWEVTLLCRPAEMFMTSFYKDIGSIELSKVLILDEVKSSVLMEREQNKSLFIHAFRNLLEEYSIKLIEHCDLPEYGIDGLVPSSELNEEDIKDLLKAKPCSLDKAEQARQRGYKDREEMLNSKSAILANHYKISRIGVEEAELECIPVLRHSAIKMEIVVSLLRGDKGATVKELLISAGISLNLFKKQRLTQEQIKALRDGIASKCAELFRLGLIKERYVKQEKIPEETPIKFIKEVLVSWGLMVETWRGRANDRERQLEISVPTPLARRLNLDTKTEKEVLQEKALKLRSEGLGYGLIAKELGLKDKHQARRLLET